LPFRLCANRIYLAIVPAPIAIITPPGNTAQDPAFSSPTQNALADAFNVEHSTDDEENAIDNAIPYLAVIPGELLQEGSPAVHRSTHMNNTPTKAYMVATEGSTST